MNSVKVQIMITVSIEEHGPAYHTKRGHRGVQP